MGIGGRKHHVPIVTQPAEAPKDFQPTVRFPTANVVAGKSRITLDNTNRECTETSHHAVRTTTLRHAVDKNHGNEFLGMTTTTQRIVPMDGCAPDNIGRLAPR